MGDNSKDRLDPSSRYYFHQSDTSATKLCSQLLDGGNWATWSRSVEISLSVKNKLGFVTGKFKKPSKSTNPDEFDLWERANHMLISWFSHSVSQDLVPSVLFAPTAQHVWEDFQARFAQGNLPRIFQIQSSISSHVQGAMSIANYYTKLRGFWDELDSYRPFSTKRNAHHNEDRLMQFLMGLNATYNPIRGQILLLKPVPDIRETYNMVTQDEKQREIGNNSLAENFSIAAAMRFHKGFNPNNKFSGNSSFSSSTSNTEGLFCRYCKKDTHTIESCYKLHGFPVGHPQYDPNFKPKYDPNFKPPRNRPGQQNQQYGARSNPTAAHAVSPNGATLPLSGLSAEQYQQLTTAMANAPQFSKGNNDVFANVAGLCTHPSVNTISSNCWILDSGATDHIASDSSLFVHFHPPHTPCVNLPTGSTVPINSTGTLLFNKDIILKDVLHVPSFRLNLLSASKITQSLNCCVILFPDFCVLQDLATGKMIGWGKQSGGLYYMSPDRTLPTACHSTHPNATWHHRLGHPSHDCLRLISKSNSSKTVPFENFCNVCPLAKQTRLPFPLSSISSTLPFQLIHCDIWGPHRHQTYSGARYFLTIVDDFTRCTWLFLMSHKSDASSLLKSFFTFVHNQFNAHIKIFRSDNGSEFLSLQSFFITKGIEFQTSCVSTPQQNGVVERKHGHILRVARALLFQSNMPIRFWGECVTTAVYLINRLPTRLLSNITPFERLYGHPPTYDHLRVFKSLCYATIVKPVSKFAPRARRCVFLGYPTGQKGYKLLDLDSHKFLVSRDVRFMSISFPIKGHLLLIFTPFLHLHPTSTTPHLYPILLPHLPTIYQPITQPIHLPQLLLPTPPIRQPIPQPISLPTFHHQSLNRVYQTHYLPLLLPHYLMCLVTQPDLAADLRGMPTIKCPLPILLPHNHQFRRHVQPEVQGTLFLTLSHIHVFLLPIILSLLLFLVSVSPLTMIRQFLTRNGGMLCKLNLMPLLAIILGLLFLYLLVISPLAANGYTRSSTIQTGLLNVIRPASLLKVTLKLKELII
ncbi:hypothetical protein RHGRI_037606 [Rhododendron griersonianum]|uniref:Integrase catalytic domain-containing protein n=1 Tax=Rhododendron griersonianum TaxID=479676 RepID=A0AAV6HT39_9ERIC|nr:hypothetical protein RHGRI_037606 [Rhododendron griersonianum]